MVFLVRAMRSDPLLRAFKVVVVTDRTDLEKQLAETAKLSGEGVQRARRVSKLRTVPAEKGPALVFAMIQKYRDADSRARARCRCCGTTCRLCCPVGLKPSSPPPAV